MARPEILKAVHELDDSGYYNNTEYLGDLTSDTTCLDTVKKNGIYSFIAYRNLGDSTTEKCKWSLRVYACEDCSHVEQIAEPFDSKSVLEQYKRVYKEGKWTEFAQENNVVYFGAEDSEDTIIGSIALADADTLGGHSASYFATKTEVQTAQSKAESAMSAAEAAQSSADNKAEILHTQEASTITEGVFAGDVVAISTNRNTTCLRNSEVRITSATGTVQSTNKIIYVRK